MRLEYLVFIYYAVYPRLLAVFSLTLLAALTGFYYYFTDSVLLFWFIYYFMSSYWSKNSKYSMPISFSSPSTNFTYNFLFTISFTFIVALPNYSYIESLQIRWASSYYLSYTMKVNAQLKFSYFEDVNWGVVSNFWPELELNKRTNVPFRDGSFNKVYTIVALIVLFRIIFLSFIFISTYFLSPLSSYTASLIVPLFFLSKFIQKSFSVPKVFKTSIKTSP